jgi:hypothetical protein
MEKKITEDRKKANAECVKNGEIIDYIISRAKYWHKESIECVLSYSCLCKGT